MYKIICICAYNFHSDIYLHLFNCIVARNSFTIPLQPFYIYICILEIIYVDMIIINYRNK